MKNNKIIQTELYKLRNQIVDFGLIVGALLTVITYLLSVTKFFDTGFQISYITDLLVVIVILIITIFRKRIKLSIKSFFIIGGLFLVLFIDLMQYGLLSANKVVIVLIPFFALLIFPLKRAIVLSGFAMLGFIIVAFLVISGNDPLLIQGPSNLFKISSWLINFFLLLIVASLIFIASYQYARHYSRLLHDLQLRNQELAENEARFSSLMDSMNEIIVVGDNNHVIEYVNKHFTDKLGYPPEEVIGKSVFDLFHSPEKIESIKNAILNKSNNQDNTYEIRLSTKDGLPLDFLVSGSPYINAKGEIIGSIGAMTDITKRKEMEKALYASQQQFETLARMSPVGIFRTRPDGYTNYVNPKWSELSGLPFEEALGDGWLNALHPEDRKKIEKNWQQVTREENSSFAEYRFLKSDGSITWVLGNAVPEIIDGELKGYIGTITNITDKKNIEQELEKHRNHLEELVKERTDELNAANEELKSTNEELFRQKEELSSALKKLKETQDQLIQNEKMASLGILTSGVGHEINNPLNFIQAGLYSLENYFSNYTESDDFFEHREKINQIKDRMQIGVDRVAEIVKGLSHFSRQSETLTEEVDMHSVIDNCLLILYNQYKNRVEITKQYTEENVVMTGNDGKLHQVVLNLLVNAIHSIERNGKIIINTDKENGDLKISIKDNGTGISEENLGKIFDPFFTTKEVGKGTGLGLSIVYGIVKEHKGKIDIKSAQGVGTEVIILLPLDN